MFVLGLADVDAPTLRHDIGFLRMAVSEARSAFADGCFPTGAVLVGGNGDLISACRNDNRHRRSFLAHPELTLLLQHEQLLHAHPYTCSLYASLEPCLMCLGASMMARLGRVVWAANDHWAGGSKLIQLNSSFVRSRRTELVGPLCDEAKAASVALLDSYFESRDRRVLSAIKGHEHS